MRIIPAIFSVVLSLVVTLALTEGVIRSTGAWTELDYDRRDHFRDPGIPGVPYLLKPNLDVVWSGMRIKSNSLGLSDPHEPNTPTTCQRILILGSSTTQGFGVNSDDSYPRVLERELNTASAKCVEVINAAQDAYTIREKAALLKYLLPQYRPSLVIVDLNPFDYDDAIAVNAEGFLWEPPTSVHKHQWLSLFWENSKDPLEPYLGFSFAYRYFRPLLRNLVKKPVARIRSAIYVSPLLRQRFEEGVRAIEAQTGEAGTPLVFLPMDLPYDVRQFAETSRIADASALVGESYPKFLERYSLVWDSHPNRRGHEALARGLRDYLARQRLVEATVDPSRAADESASDQTELRRITDAAVTDYGNVIDFETRENLRQLIGGIGQDRIFNDGSRRELAVVLRGNGENTLILRGTGLKSKPGRLVARIQQGERFLDMPFKPSKGEFEIRLSHGVLEPGLVDIRIGCQKRRCGAVEFHSISLEKESR